MVTFSQLEGMSQGDQRSNPLSALDVWYDAVKFTPIDKLDVRDIAVAIRQRLYLQEVVPLSINILEKDPLAGAQFDGELLVSMKSVPETFWTANSKETNRLKKVLDSIVSEDRDLSSDVAFIRAKLPP